MKKLFPISFLLLLCIVITMSHAFGQKAGNENVRRASEHTPDTEVTEAPDSDATIVSVAAEAFQLLPDPDLDLLTKSMRFQMIAYMEVDSIKKQSNIYGGQSWIEQMNADYIAVHLSNVSNIVLKHLECPKLKGESLIMSIYTISSDSDTADSTIKFYAYNDENDTTTLKPLPAKQFFNLPDPSDFFHTKKGGLSKSQIEEALPFHTIAYSISATGDTLTGRPTIDNYLTQEERARIAPYMVKEIKWKWDGKKFNKLKTI